MLELFTFLVVLAIIRGWHRARPEPQRSSRIDIYHHWSGGGPGETQPQEAADGPLLMSPEELDKWFRDWGRRLPAAYGHEATEPLLLTERVDNVVPMQRRR